MHKIKTVGVEKLSFNNLVYFLSMFSVNIDVKQKIKTVEEEYLLCDY